MICSGCGIEVESANLCLDCERKVLKYGVPDFCRCCKSVGVDLINGACSNCRQEFPNLRAGAEQRSYFSKDVKTNKRNLDVI